MHFKMYFFVLLFLACAVVASATKQHHSPELYFKKGEKYSILGTENLAVVVEDDTRKFAHSSKSPKLAIKLCKSIGAGKHSCTSHLSIIALGLPSTKKTILFNGISVSVQLNKAAKSITLVGMMKWCDSGYCGKDGGKNAKDITMLTFVPTTASPQVLPASDPVRFLQLHVSDGFSGGGSTPSMIAGADNQLVAVGGYQKPSSVFAIGNGTSSALQEPTATQILFPVGLSMSQYNSPVFYDGTQYWLYCNCGPSVQLKSSLSQGVVMTFPTDFGWNFPRNGLAYANGIVWLQPDQNSMTTFKRFNNATQESVDFEVNSAVAKSYSGGGSGGFTVSSDGSILYLVSYDWDTQSIDILSISTTTRNELNLVRGKLPAGIDPNNFWVCGVAMTTKGVAVCLTVTWNTANTMYVPIYAV